MIEQDTTVTIRMPMRVKEALTRLAAQNNEPMSRMIRRVLIRTAACEINPTPSQDLDAVRAEIHRYVAEIEETLKTVLMRAEQ